MTSQVATSHSVGAGEYGKDAHNAQRPTEELWESQISEYLGNKFAAFFKREILAPSWSGKGVSHYERGTLLSSICTTTLPTLLSELHKDNFSSVESEETYTGMPPILVARTDGQEPIMSLQRGQSNSSVERDIFPASGAIGPKVRPAADRCGSRVRTSGFRIMASSLWPSECGPTATVDSIANAEHTAHCRGTEVRCDLVNSRSEEKAACVCLLDTGAEVSAVTRSRAARVLGNDNFDPVDSSISLIGIGGGMVKPIGKLTCRFQLACSKESIPITLYVLEDHEVAGYDICLSRWDSVATGHIIIRSCDGCNGLGSCN